MIYDCVNRKSTHETLQRRTKLWLKILGFAAPKSFRVENVNQNVRSIQSCESIYDNSLRSNALSTTLRTITCN